jgi:hypothetical protein
MNGGSESNRDFSPVTFSHARLYPINGSSQKGQDLILDCLLEQNLCKDIHRINLDLFAIHIMANLCGKLMLQLAEADYLFMTMAGSLNGWVAASNSRVQIVRS